MVVTKTDLDLKNNKLAFVLNGVFTNEECKELIARSETTGYVPALVNVGGGRQMLMSDVRNNDRAIIDDEELARNIFERIKDYVPKKHQGHDCRGLNERLRFLRYDPGQEFKAHCDGCYVRTRYDCKTPEKEGEYSAYTVQVYLNSDCTGGATTFFIGDGETDESLDCQPNAGNVLFFEQSGVWHQGSQVVTGRKYVIRTEVMYASEYK